MRLSWTVLLLVIVASPLAPPNLLRAETPLCTWGGYSTFHEAVAIGDYPPTVFNGGEEKSIAVRHAALRAILVVERCPETAERVLSENPKSTEHWTAAIREILNPYYVQKRMAVDLTDLAERLNCSAGTPFVCGVRQQLLGDSMAMSRQAAHTNSCNVFGPTLMSEAVDDFKHSGGDFVAATSDLAFLLASCPESFLAYMHDHGAELNSWLDEVQNSLFWGDQKDEPRLNAYRRSLIEFVKVQPTEYKAERKQVLERLEQTHVRLTQ